MKILIFGTGDYYDRYKKWFAREDILALLDNSPFKQGTFLDGLPIRSPEEGIALPFDAVVILSFYVKEMKSQLMKLGVPPDRIFHFFDLHRLIDLREQRKPIQYYGKSEKIFISENLSVKKVLFLSHDLNLGGPAIALYHAARILQKQGYQVIYASMINGPLREKLMAEKIPLIVDPNLQIETMKEAEWVSSFSLLFCNTISYYWFLSDRDVEIPVIWWLHDSSFFYSGVDRQVLQRLDRRNLRLISVGPVPSVAFREIVPDMRIGILLYGVEDIRKQETVKKQVRLLFGTIGYIEWRKGQDLLIQAVRALLQEFRDRVDFCLIGQDSSAMAWQIREEAASMPEVRLMGTVDRECINRVLEHADLLICPSREDPMPTVVAEAMMHSVPCLVSDATGTAAYIRDGVDGFIFHSENVEELTEKIKWCILHHQELEEMGIRARNIYETHFSMEVFEKNLLAVVRDSLECIDL